MVHHDVRLPCDPASAAQARVFAGESYEEDGVDAEAVEAARLVVGELVTNAVLHGRSTVQLHLWAEGGVLGGEITDYGTGTPTLLQPLLTGTRGRGLGIVAATTSAWGVRAHDEGKTVWFELSHPVVHRVQAAEQITVDDLPEELQARLRAAASEPARLVIEQQQAAGDAGDEYVIYAIAGDRFVHMVMSLRPDGSVAEATETFRRDEIHRVVTIGDDRVAVEIEHGPERRWTTVPPQIAAAFG